MGVGRVFGAALGHGGAGYAYHVENIFVKPDDTLVQINWTDPCDIHWMGTKIVRKTGTYPESVTDGVLVADCQVRNQYAQTAYLDTDLVNGTTYYYMAFPYSQKGCNVSTLNRAERVTPAYGLYWWTYSGAHTSSVITVDGVQRRLITMTGSGILTVDGNVTGGVCLVGGGGRGGTAVKDSYGGGGGIGGQLVQYTSMPLSSSVITIGAGGTYSSTTGGNTVCMGLTASGRGSVVDGKGGGSGSANGDGVSKYPFGLTFLYAHSGGGGGGGFVDSWNTKGPVGGQGGTNGGAGTNASGNTSVPSGGYGGVRGGGSGGRSYYDESEAGYASSFYGSGGGGGAAYSTTVNVGGNGSSGIAYILLPNTREEGA